MAELFSREAIDAIARPRYGRYRVVAEVGSGGYGVVYKGHDDQLDRAVAIKVFFPYRLDCPEKVNEHLAEARLLAKLDSVGIVPIYDVGKTDDGICYLVSKFMDGTDLVAKLRLGRLSIAESVQIIRGAARALHQAHEHGLVHRDIKPGNILLDRRSGPHITDFGLALRGDVPSPGSRFAGTPAYMSPEQARGEGNRLDARSDVYSLGVVFYELLTGRLPFHADNEVELLDLIVLHEVKPPRQLDPTIPKELDKICVKALAKRPEDRYPSALELAKALEKWELEQDAWALGYRPASAAHSDNRPTVIGDVTPIDPPAGGPIESPAATETWEGAQIGEGRYLLMEKLGEGGMAVVYRAKDRRLNKDLAVKVPRPSVIQQEQLLLRFRHEVHSLVKLAHPHVCTVLDVGEHQGLPFAVMQCISGGTLRDRHQPSADGTRTLTQPGSILDWLRMVARALDFLHEQGFVHRDVKPTNILFDDQGNPYLSDFGVIKELNRAGRGAGGKLTKTGVVLGTPGYMAPEMIAGKPHDGRADQYALAVLVYELLAGKSPFSSLELEDMYNQQLNGKIPPLYEARPDLSRELSQVVQKALDFYPTRRYPTCGEFVKEFARAAEMPASSRDTAIPPSRQTAGPRVRETPVEINTPVALPTLSGEPATMSLPAFRASDIPQPPVPVTTAKQDPRLSPTRLLLFSLQSRHRKMWTWFAVAAAVALLVVVSIGAILNHNRAVEQRELAQLVESQKHIGREVYGRILPATAWIIGDTEGTGSLIDRKRGLLLTAYHVVGKKPNADVYFPIFSADGKLVTERNEYRKHVKPIRATVLEHDDSLDLAVLELESVPHKVSELRLASASAKGGDVVHSLGNARDRDDLWGYNSGAVRGVVHKPGYRLSNGQILNAWMVDMQNPINAGDSGGPLVNNQGEIVGVNCTGLRGSNLLTAAIDISEVRKILERLQKKQNAAGP